MGELMNLDKVYYDIYENPCNIMDMVRRCPEWAANRIQAGEAERDWFLSVLKDIENRATRIQENKAIVGIEASFIYQITRNAIAKVSK